MNKYYTKNSWKRKGDCAWSCLRWQTQPEKICKTQRTNQSRSLLILYWFVLRNLQIFSGCVFHLEQLHAQSPFLFPIVFGINLIPFSIFAQYLLSFHSFVQVCAPLLGKLLGRNCCCQLWLCQLGFGVSLRAATSNLPSSPNNISNRSVLHDGRKRHKTVVFSQPNAHRPRNRARYKSVAELLAWGKNRCWEKFVATAGLMTQVNHQATSKMDDWKKTERGALHKADMFVYDHTLSWVGSEGGVGGGGVPRWKMLSLESMCELLRSPLSAAQHIDCETDFQELLPGGHC